MDAVLTAAENDPWGEYRLSAEAREALELAERLAAMYGDSLQPEHVFFSLLRLSKWGVAGLLSSAGMDPMHIAALLREELRRTSANTEALPLADLALAPVGPRVESLLECAAAECALTGAQQIRCLHILLALRSEPGQFIESLWPEAAPNLESLRSACKATLEEEQRRAELDEVARNLDASDKVKQSGEKPMEFYNFFSFSAKKAIYRASEICTQFNNQYLEPEHILYSVLNLRSCSAVQLLHQLGINLAKLTYSVEAYLYEHAGSYKGNAIFSQRTMSLLDLAYKEVKRLHHREIGTTHVLIALIQDRTSFLRGLFEEQGLDARRLREAFITHLKGHSAGAPRRGLPTDADPQVAQAKDHWAGELLNEKVRKLLEPEALMAITLATRCTALFGLRELSPLCLLCGLLMAPEEYAAERISAAGGRNVVLFKGVVAALNAEKTELENTTEPPNAQPPSEETEARDAAPDEAGEARTPGFDEFIEQLPKPVGAEVQLRLSDALLTVLSRAFTYCLRSTSAISAGRLLRALLDLEDAQLTELLTASGCDITLLREQLAATDG